MSQGRPSLFSLASAHWRRYKAGDSILGIERAMGGPLRFTVYFKAPQASRQRNDGIQGFSLWLSARRFSLHHL